MTPWTTRRIDQLGRVVTGKTPPSERPEEFGDIYPFITPSDIPATQKHVTVERYLSERGMEAHRRIQLPKKSICVVCIGATVGKVCMSDRLSVSNQQINSIIPTKGEFDADFVYYISTTLKDSLVAFAGGAATPIINKSAFSSIKLLVPEFEAQQKIAAILSAYDELIENNRRRVALLEKLAEEIYREWFVRLRFPGHKHVRRNKRVPNGWEIVELKTVANEAGRSTRSGEHLADRFYLPLDLLDTKQMLPAGHLPYTEAQSSLVTFETGDFLFGAMRPYQHKVAIAPFSGITRTTCFVIQPKSPEAWSWLFLTLFQESSVDFATNICNGSDRPYAVWNKAMERMKVLRPTEALLKRFEETVRPILESIVSMYFIQLKIIAARDLLLPRLISGKLCVENLDIQFPPGMAEELNGQTTIRVDA